MPTLLDTEPISCSPVWVTKSSIQYKEFKAFTGKYIFQTYIFVILLIYGIFTRLSYWREAGCSVVGLAFGWHWRFIGSVWRVFGLELGVVDGARGWIAGRAGLCGVFATWVWSWQLQPPPRFPPCVTWMLIGEISLIFGAFLKFNQQMSTLNNFLKKILIFLSWHLRTSQPQRNGRCCFKGVCILLDCIVALWTWNHIKTILK